ncbi:MAG: hypothetical protein ABSB67_15030 [Bryobacteraceae bacterium]
MGNDADYRIRFGGHAHAFVRGLAAFRGESLHLDGEILEPLDRIAHFIAIIAEINRRGRDKYAENRPRGHLL